MPAPGKRVDPYGNFNFLVEIDGITRAAFHEVSGFDSTIDVIEHREGGENTTPRKLPGRRSTRTSSSSGASPTTPSCTTGTATVGRRASPSQRKNGSIVLLDRQRHGEGCAGTSSTPGPRSGPGPALNAEGNDVAIETLELAHEGRA